MKGVRCKCIFFFYKCLDVNVVLLMFISVVLLMFFSIDKMSLNLSSNFTLMAMYRSFFYAIQVK